MMLVRYDMKSKNRQKKSWLKAEDFRLHSRPVGSKKLKDVTFEVYIPVASPDDALDRLSDKDEVVLPPIKE